MSATLNPIMEEMAVQIAAAVMKEIRNAPPIQSPWFKEAQAAEYLRVKTRGMANHRRMGTGPKWCMPGGVIRYHRDDLDAYMRSGEGKSAK